MQLLCDGPDGQYCAHAEEANVLKASTNKPCDRRIL